jgi:hypothetical protein
LRNSRGAYMEMGFQRNESDGNIGRH